MTFRITDHDRDALKLLPWQFRDPLIDLTPFNPPVHAPSFDKIVSDLLSIPDVVGVELKSPIFVDDLIAIADNAVTLLEVSGLDRSVSDTVAVSDAVARIVEFERVAVDAVVVADTSIAVMEFERSQDDTVAVTDNAERGLELDAIVTDTAAVIDSAQAPYPNNGDELAVMLDHSDSPTSMWRGNESSGATDLEGSNNLTDVSTPTHSIADSLLSSLTVEFDSGGATDALKASATSVLDIGTGSFAALWVGRFVTVPGSTRSVLGKRITDIGYELIGNSSGHILTLIDSGATQNVNTVSDRDYATGGAVIGILSVLDATAGELQTWVWKAGTVATPGATTHTAGSLANASATFQIGDNEFRSSCNTRMALTAFWDGDSAIGLTGTELGNVMDALGLT